jgi:hypothetical protein
MYSRIWLLLVAIVMASPQVATAQALSNALRPFVATPPYTVLVNGVPQQVDIGNKPKSYRFAGIPSFVNPQTGGMDVATMLAGGGLPVTASGGVYGGASIPRQGIPERIQIVNGNQTMIAYRAGDQIVAGRCRTQLSSFAVPSRRKVGWLLEFSLGDAERTDGWPLTPPGKQPVLLWELKAPGVQPSLAIIADTDPSDPSSVMIFFSRKSGNAQNVVKLGEVRGLSRFKPVVLSMEAYLDERELVAGGQGYWRVWVNGQSAVDTVGPTLSALASAPHQWFLATYLYQDVTPSENSRVVFWRQAEMLAAD